MSLKIVYGDKGLDRLDYGGETLEDLERWPEDAFHIWHMKAFDLAGHPLSSGQFGWGENHDARVFDEASKTWRYTFTWGTIALRYRQRGDALDMIVTAANNRNSGIVFDGATLYPLALHLPRVPVGFGGPLDSRFVNDMEQPAIAVADYGRGAVAVVAPDPAKPIYIGLEASGKNFTYSPVISSTALGSEVGPEYPGRLLKPGQTDTVTVSLRFGPTGTASDKLAPDAYEAFAARYPQTLHWKDRRIVGTVFLASSPQGDKTIPSGFPRNPRRFFNDPAIDIDTPDGLQRFQLRILAQAATVVANLKRLHAQGAITWDIEGEQYPQDTSYACSPDQVAQLAPEMESIVLDRASPYAGMKLDDAYFRIVHDAGFRVGVCVRPQRLALAVDGTARQMALPDSEVAANLIGKMKYAHDRWGATLFYLDSTVEADGKTLPSFTLEKAAAALPDSLLIPEESSPRMYRATAPFKTFLFHGDLGTTSEVWDLYPEAFSLNLIDDVSTETLQEHRTPLAEAVRQGDVLMLLSGYWQANNAAAVEIYRIAAKGASGK